MKKVYVAECRLGRGLFAARALRRGETLLLFTGRRRSLREVIGRPDSFNMLQVGPEDYLDLEAPGLFVNHSCEPNAGVRENTTLIALRDLRADEEIHYDYSTTMDEDLETMRCGCGTRRCRGLVGDFRHLPGELRRHYLGLGLVQGFIRERHGEECLVGPQEGAGGW